MMKQRHKNQGNRNIYIFIIFILLLRLILDLSYSNIITVNYSYANFKDATSNVWIIVSWAILAIGTALAWKNYISINRISNEVIFILYIISFVPFTSMVAHGQFDSEFVLLGSVYWIFVFLAQKVIPKNTKRKFFVCKQVKNLNLLLEIIAIFGVLLIVYISGRYSHFRINLSLSSDIVYDYRRQASNNNLAFYVRYPFMWTQSVMPILLAYFISKKNKLFIFICIMAQILSFGYDGQKTPILMTVFVIVFNVFRNINIRELNKWVLVGIVGVLGLGLVEFFLLKSYWIAGVLTRRVFFLPNMVSYYYYDFFSTHTPDYFRSSVLSDLFFYNPYPQLQYTIGQTYLNANYWMNNGLISDAITNLGKPGVFLFPWLVAYVLRLLDRCSEGIDMRIYIACSFSIALSLINSFLSVILVSHGVIVLMILLFVMKRAKNERSDKKQKIRIKGFNI